MYQAIYYDRSEYTYYLRDDKKGWLDFQHNPTVYRLDPDGEFQTIDGKRVSPAKFDWKDNSLYEKDVDRLTRVLVDTYYKSDDVASYQNIIYFDIECEIGGALTPEYIKSAPMKITSISLYDVNEKKYYCLILDEDQKLEKTINDNKEIIPYKSEIELLKAFLLLWEQCDPTIVSGWNSGFFDVPYLYYRICNTLGRDQASRLSPIGKININDYTPDQPVELGGINHLDYMRLFKKYVTKQEPSYKLGDIGEKYVKLGKVEYEGSLDRLFRENINTFIEYNLRDVEIIIKLEEKLKFINLSITICHLCHVPYEQIYLSTVLNDGAILTYLKRKGIISPNKPTTYNEALKTQVNDDYAGGYLKDPVPGLYEWVIDLDFTSLYPSIIRSLNMGIETLVGRIINTGKYDNKWTLAELEQKDPDELVTIEKLNDNRTTTRTQVKIGKIIEIIKNNNFIIAANGSIFRTDKSSVVCEILTDWFNKRTEYKDLMKDAFKVKKDPELGEFYNRRQHAYKIKLNDVYGVFAIPGWRYTDGHKMISSAITLTGQRLTQESISFVNEWMNEKLGTQNKDYIVTSDTDSLFIQVKDILISKGIDMNNKEAIIEETLKIATEIQKVANENLNRLVKELFNINDRKHYFELKQEVVLERGYFAGKRRYAMFIVNKEGVPVEELDMKGLDLMKSNMPKNYKKFGEDLLQDIMFGKPKNEIDKQIINFKKSLANINWKEIAKPTGVKMINKYIKRKPKPGEIFSELELKCPINTKSAIYYNDLIRFKKLDHQYPCFTEGDKMKYVKLKPNPYKIDVIGFTGNDPEFIINFIDQYADKEDAFDSVLLNKLTGVYEDLKWEFPILNEKVTKFFKFGFEN
jgi:DNA polymerase elongation subunit (family B)